LSPGSDAHDPQVDRRAAIAFAGTPQFAVPALQTLLASDRRITHVLTQPDRPSGRGRRLTASPIKELALSRGLRVIQPAALKRATPRLDDWEPVPDLLVVAAYGLLLPQWLLDWPRHGALNIHASLLPRWRGAAPIQRAIIAGDTQSGISLMKMELGLDTGPVFVRESVEIGARETAGALHDRLADLGARMLHDSLDRILAGALSAVAQDESKATYAAKIDKREARLDWRRPAVELERQVRAFNSWPVAESRLESGATVRIWAARALAAPVDALPGTIVACHRDGIDVATGAGVLRIETLQLPGSKAMAASAYLTAHNLQGARFVV
jgi:methionyl-tRNA formyltransferase